MQIYLASLILQLDVHECIPNTVLLALVVPSSHSPPRVCSRRLTSIRVAASSAPFPALISAWGELTVPVLMPISMQTFIRRGWRGPADWKLVLLVVL